MGVSELISSYRAMYQTAHWFPESGPRSLPRSGRLRYELSLHGCQTCLRCGLLRLLLRVTALVLNPT